MMIESCPNCGEAFIYNEYEDLIGYLNRAIKGFKEIKNLNVNLIIGGEDE